MAVNRDDAAHLLRRVGVGGTDAEIDALVGLTRGAAVNRVLRAALDAPTPARPQWIDDREWYRQMTATGWWMDRLMHSPAPLQEKMTLFWHGHFATEQQKVYEMDLMMDQNMLFRTEGLGNFRDLVQAVSVQPAMLIYLDNETNEKGAEQENFARELMELFTLGVGNYTEGDVISMAKAWTGYNTVGYVKINGTWTYVSDYVFKPELHDNSNKTLFGITRNWSGPAAIDEICYGSKAVQCSRFIARKLWRFFAHNSPSAALVDSLAATFRAENLNIAELVRAILTHPEFWGDESRFALVKSPVEYVGSLVKRTGVPVEGQQYHYLMSGMGQVLFEPPNVAGWKNNGYWLSTATAWGRARFATFMRWKIDDVGFLDSIVGGENPAAIAGRIISELGIVEPSPATVAEIAAWAQRCQSNGLRWSLQPNGFLLGALSPDFQLA